MKDTTENIKFKAAWNYAPAPEATDHVQIRSSYDLFINGQFVPPKNKVYFETSDPSNEKILAKVAMADNDDVDLAVVVGAATVDVAVALGRAQMVIVALQLRQGAAGRG